jgi:putative methionine-R-sulfoxide reductase with GAF domain
MLALDNTNLKSVTNDDAPEYPRQPMLSLEELEAILIDFSTSMHDQNEEEDILWDLTQNCISRLGFTDCVVYLLDETNMVLVQKAALGAKNPDRFDILNPIEIPVGQGITGYVAQTGTPLLVGDTSLDSRYLVDDEVRFSEICVPIKSGGRVIGVIDSEHPAKYYFQPQHLRILTAIASICANKLLRVRSEKQKDAAKLLLNELKSRAFQARLSPHFVFNALNAIQHFILLEDKSASLRYLALLGKLIRYQLSNFEKDQALLSEELMMLDWYLKLQTMRYESKFVYQLENLIHHTDPYIPTLILSSMMEFAVERSVFFQQGLSTLHVLLELENGGVAMHLRFGPIYPAQSFPEKPEDYRMHFIPWKDQADLLNRINGYQIETDTSFQPVPQTDAFEMHIRILLPILPQIA